ncbi:MAG: phosphoribosylformylglycinamidine synthase subunit PurQ, partial [Firmicutes bacterium]|nr:phosphoribosylformylglycinamidine synthase subunit PurQ [Bacillota bacterium]
GYSSYGNQIGLATGIVDEIYHPGYEAKRMEIGAVIAATPAENVRRERPVPGDIVIMLGGSTGRDGIGGATGSSKAHTAHSVEDCGAEVQKGNAPEERKLQRLFRNAEASKMIKRCNDFGAGGVSVAIGELAEGLEIELDKVPKKYDGLDGTELAISESQERMAVVIAKEDEERFLEIARSENLQAVKLADVIEEPRLRMHWNGKYIVDISRAFLDSNGAEKHIEIDAAVPALKDKEIPASFKDGVFALAEDLNCCSKRGLAERFDSTIGAGTVLMPFGGKYQLTPAQAMVQKISVEKKHTDDCSVMAFGYNPFVSEQSPYHGAYLAVAESVCKLVASGAEFKDVYLSLQEYFEKPMRDSKRWGKPFAALLGAFDAQMDFGIGAIGGKDSMSGSFENINVPPTLVSFAVTTDKTENIISPEFKKAGSVVKLVKPAVTPAGLPDAASLKNIFKEINARVKSGQVISAYTCGMGGVGEAVMKMAMGNGLGFEYDDAVSLKDIFDYSYGAFVLELNADEDFGITLGRTTENAVITYKGESVKLDELEAAYEDTLESVYPSKAETNTPTENFCFTERSAARAIAKVAKPTVLIPVFPGTNCEYDSAKAMADAGAEAKIFVINNLSPESIAKSADDFAKLTRESQMIFIPGGFSGGDEPDGSGKFITAFFRNAAVKDAVTDMLDNRACLMLGICNGFRALIKLGLVPYGKIMDTDESCPTLSFNTLPRHQSR